jgi:hypothetical protein
MQRESIGIYREYAGFKPGELPVRRPARKRPQNKRQEAAGSDMRPKSIDFVSFSPIIALSTICSGEVYMNFYPAPRKSAIFLVLVLALVVGGFSIVQDQIRTLGKPQPPAVKWQVTVSAPNPNMGNISGSAILEAGVNATQVDMSLPTKDCACYGFRIRLSLASARLLFKNIAIAAIVPGGIGPSRLPGGVDGFLNAYPQPYLDTNTPSIFGYDDLLVRFSFDADAVNAIPLGGSAPLSNCGYLHLSWYSSTSPSDSLYGFTTVENLWMTRKMDGGWALEFDQGIELLEQKYETTTYYVGKSRKTSYRLVVSQEILTAPVRFIMQWNKKS